MSPSQTLDPEPSAPPMCREQRRNRGGRNARNHRNNAGCLTAICALVLGFTMLCGVAALILSILIMVRIENPMLKPERKFGPTNVGRIESEQERRDTRPVYERLKEYMQFPDKDGYILFEHDDTASSSAKKTHTRDKWDAVLFDAIHTAAIAAGAIHAGGETDAGDGRSYRGGPASRMSQRKR